MVNVIYDDSFIRQVQKVKDASFKERVKKLVEKIIVSPDVGKPMRYERKGSREVYLPPYRLMYAYLPEENKLIFLDMYHKDEQ